MRAEHPDWSCLWCQNAAPWRVEKGATQPGFACRGGPLSTAMFVELGRSRPRGVAGGVRHGQASFGSDLPHAVGGRKLSCARRVALCALRRSVPGCAGSARLPSRGGMPLFGACRGAGGLRRALDRRARTARTRGSPEIARRSVGHGGARGAARRTASLSAHGLGLVAGAFGNG